MNYKDKSQDYYSNVRLDLISLIDKEHGQKKILEIGAAYGSTLNYLKLEGIASEVVAVDLFEDFLNKDLYKEVDNFIFGDIEKLDLSQYNNYFDIILLPDVLEHLIDPQATLTKIKKLLKNNGSIFISIPNIRHYSVFKKIFIRGDFRYEESGILDYTHLRFFCKKNIVDLVNNSQLKLNTITSSIKLYKGKSTAKIINKLTFGFFEDFLTVQYLVKSSKKNE
jgi:2-polyprenyl-3-methyl-5-hydroxy-6-metoxy-1,4-benzoquinol methylase